jgi:hypothetical protein
MQVHPPARVQGVDNVHAPLAGQPITFPAPLGCRQLLDEAKHRQEIAPRSCGQHNP